MKNADNEKHTLVKLYEEFKAAQSQNLCHVRGYPVNELWVEFPHSTCMTTIDTLASYLQQHYTVKVVRHGYMFIIRHV